MHLVRHMKSLASESKAFQSCSTVEIRGQSSRKEQLQIEIGIANSDTELFIIGLASEPGLP